MRIIQRVSEGRVIEASLKHFYHGTDGESAYHIMMNGVDYEVERKHDPGDFGWGFYLTKSKARANTAGRPVVLDVTVDLTNFAYIPNPYFLDKMERISPNNSVEEMFFLHAFDNGGTNMLTIHDKDREGVCQKIRDQFLSEGFLGITTDYHGSETVVFHEIAIKQITWTR